MSVSTSTTTDVLFPQQRFEFPKRRRRSNSSNQVLAHYNIKAVRAPRRDAPTSVSSNTANTFNATTLTKRDYSIPRPPRLAYDTTTPTFTNTRMTMTPPSRPEYGITHSYYYGRGSIDEGIIRDSHHRPILPRPPASNRVVEAGKKVGGVSGASIPLTAQMLDYHERIEKRTKSDDAEDPKLSDQVTLLQKEIESVKQSLAGLQKDHKTMLKEKKELEEQYKNAKNEVTKTIESSNEMLSLHEMLNAKVEKLSLNLATYNNETTATSDKSSDKDLPTSSSSSIHSDEEMPEEYKNIMNNCMQQAQELNLLQAQLEKSKAEFRQLLNVKEDIEAMLGQKEREYLEGIRQCEAVTNGQARMINSMEILLMDSRHNSSSNNNSSNHNNATVERKKLKKQRIMERVAEKDAYIDRVAATVPAEELIPTYMLSPPQSRRVSYTNPISLFTDEELVRHQNRYGLAKEWVEDSKVSQCQQAGCSVKFNFWNRRHHCRRCGNIFCNTHSAYSMLLFPDGSEDWGGVWSRVCEGCFNDT